MNKVFTIDWYPFVCKPRKEGGGCLVFKVSKKFIKQKLLSFNFTDHTLGYGG
jgi:hypothetical protein